MIININESNPQVAYGWARNMLCARMVTYKFPDRDKGHQAEIAAMLNGHSPDVDTIRRGYLQVCGKERDMMIWSIHQLHTSDGLKLREIGEMLTLDYAGIYLDEDQIDVFLCDDEDVSKMKGDYH